MSKFRTCRVKSPGSRTFKAPASTNSPPKIHVTTMNAPRFRGANSEGSETSMADDSSEGRDEGCLHREGFLRVCVQVGMQLAQLRDLAAGVIHIPPGSQCAGLLRVLREIQPRCAHLMA